jgi:hypothetical protein
MFRHCATACGRRWNASWSRPGHDLTFSQFVTIKKLAGGIASVTDLARAAELNPGP